MTKQHLRHIEREVRDRLFEQDVVNSIQLILPLGGCSAKEVARGLYVCRNTLQRRLRRRGTRYSHLLHDIRCARISQLLSDPNVTLREAARRAGLSGPAALNAWCRKNLGATPGELRLRLAAARYSRRVAHILAKPVRRGPENLLAAVCEEGTEG